MHERYAAENCPSEYPVRTKCVALFQRIHGVDTFLFAMYVYEYGHECPAPNRRRVYISYLDSVQYFEPKCYRTVAYQSILIEYLRYVKKRGFHTAHIWSCPPTPGDDYIFYCHPKHQLVPREDMLRAWYHSMLDHAKALGVVIRTTNLYDEYFTDDVADPVPTQRRYPTCLPYFEGDYIPGEIENIINQMGAGAVKANEDIASQPRDDVMRRVGHNLRKMKENFIVVHLRNRKFAAAVERGEDVSNWKEDSDDEIIRSKRAKITGKCSAEPASPTSKRPTVGGKTVSTATSAASADDTKVVVDESKAAAKQSDPSSSADVSSVDQPAGSTAESNALTNEDKPAETTGDESNSANQPAETTTESSGPSKEDKPAETTGEESNSADHSSAQDEEGKGAETTGAESGLTSKEDKRAETTGTESSDPEEQAKDSDEQADGDMSPSSAKVPVDTSVETKSESKDEVNAQAASESTECKKTSSTEEVARNEANTESNAPSKDTTDDIAPAVSRGLGKTKRQSAPVADTTDEDPAVESEMFESRQQFLNYCQTTHCQFDELRRAKHSTVMVLFQLHNPMAPKFLQQCGSCYRDITHGVRYHCNQCSNFDLCDECYEPVTTGLWAKRDARFAHDKKHTFMQIDMEAAEETQKSRAERQRNLKAHVELLEHAGACSGPPGCSLQNCQRFKKLFQHVSSCTVKPKRDCRICTRLLALCTMHARMCMARGTCPIPFCDRIRERNKRLRRQQQLMDDRRRQAQNELYHAGGGS